MKKNGTALIELTTYNLRDMDGRKIVGGSVPCSVDSVDKLVSAIGLTATTTPSGALRFTRGGKAVWLGITICPEQTFVGKEEQWRAVRDRDRSAIALAKEALALEEALQEVDAEKLKAFLRSQGVL